MLSRHLAALAPLFPTRIHLFFLSSFRSDILTSLVSLILSPRRRPVRPARLTYVPIDHIVRSPLWLAFLRPPCTTLAPLKFQPGIIRFYCSRGSVWKQKVEGTKVLWDVWNRREKDVVKLSSSLRVARPGRKVRTMSMMANTLTVLKIRPLNRDGFIWVTIKFAVKGKERVVDCNFKNIIVNLLNTS